MIEVVGAEHGAEVVRFVLEHGRDPLAGLSARGWLGGLESAARPAVGGLLLRYAVRPAPVVPEDPRLDAPVDPGLRPTEMARAHRRQRIAAYAVVRSIEGILLTELSPETNAAGKWNLPGGGLEDDEEITDGLVREIHEETGQVVTSVRLLTVLTRHWVGRAPGGRVEDFHAVRVFHTADCPRPTTPVVHDRGGSTAQARWVPAEELAAMPLASGTPDALRAAGVALC